MSEITPAVQASFHQQLCRLAGSCTPLLAGHAHPSARLLATETIRLVYSELFATLRLRRLHRQVIQLMGQKAEEQKPSSGSRATGSGNRRNPHAHKAIIAATLDLLQTIHYPDLTIEAIATTAGVGKATVYRWWPSKGALVAEAVSSMLTVEDPPETDDLRADLVAAAEISIRNYAQPPGGVLITALAADLAADPELLQSFIAAFALPRRTVVRQLIQRAIDDGLLSTGLDPQLVMDMWAGAVIYRSLMKHAPIRPEFATDLVNVFLAEPSSQDIRADNETEGMRTNDGPVDSRI